MLDAYNELVAQTEEKRATTAMPELKIAKKSDSITDLAGVLV